MIQSWRIANNLCGVCSIRAYLHLKFRLNINYVDWKYRMSKLQINVKPPPDRSCIEAHRKLLGMQTMWIRAKNIRRIWPYINYNYISAGLDDLRHPETNFRKIFLSYEFFCVVHINIHLRLRHDHFRYNIQLLCL